MPSDMIGMPPLDPEALWSLLPRLFFGVWPGMLRRALFPLIAGVDVHSHACSRRAKALPHIVGFQMPCACRQLRALLGVGFCLASGSVGAPPLGKIARVRVLQNQKIGRRHTAVTAVLPNVLRLLEATVFIKSCGAVNSHSQAIGAAVGVAVYYLDKVPCLRGRFLGIFAALFGSVTLFSDVELVPSIVDSIGRKATTAHCRHQ